MPATIASLNTYAASNVAYDTNTEVFLKNDIRYQIPSSNNFFAPLPSWNLIRTIGPLTGDAVVITYDVTGTAGTTVSFNLATANVDEGGPNHTLTVTNPSTGVYVISGIIDAKDYSASKATIEPTSPSGNVNYQVTYDNDNVAVGQIVVDYVGTD